MTHACAAEGCTVDCDTEKLMCLKHWRMVPCPIQTKVYQTWRRVHRDRQAYIDARDEAVAAVRNASTAAGQGALDL